MHPVVDLLTLYFTAHVQSHVVCRTESDNSHGLLRVRPVNKHPDNLRRRHHFLIVV